jgi:alginate production protein
MNLSAKVRIGRCGVLGLALLQCSALCVAADSGDSNDGDNALKKPAALAALLGVSEDDIRPNSQFRFQLFGGPLTVGGELEAAAQFDEDFDLDEVEKDRRVRALPELKLEARYTPVQSVVLFAQAKAYLESDLIDEGGSRGHQSGWSLDQAWVMFPNFGRTGTALQIGRQKFQDRREWWWDEDMEAVRLHFGNDRTSGFVAVAERMWSGDKADPLNVSERKIRHLMATVAHEVAPRQELEFYFLHSADHSGVPTPGMQFKEDDVDDVDAKLAWLGVRYRARHKLPGLGKVHVLADVATMDGQKRETRFIEVNNTFVSGSTAREKLRGWAFDTWASWELPLSIEPYFTLGYAWASGGSAGGRGFKGDYRQTGLHGNNGKYRGMSRFRYYGEALRPELTNLQVLTASFGAPLGKHLWLETAYHRYQQVHARDDLPGARLDINPLGTSRKLGAELDLVASFEFEQRWEAELTLGAFQAGSAYGKAAGSLAKSAAFKLNYNF